MYTYVFGIVIHPSRAHRMNNCPVQSIRENRPSFRTSYSQEKELTQMPPFKQGDVQIAATIPRSISMSDEDRNTYGSRSDCHSIPLDTCRHPALKPMGKVALNSLNHVRESYRCSSHCLNKNYDTQLKDASSQMNQWIRKQCSSYVHRR